MDVDVDVDDDEVMCGALVMLVGVGDMGERLPAMLTLAPA